MKLLFFLLACTLCTTAAAQHLKPASFVSAFEYGEAQGVNGSNYLDAVQQPDGSVLIKPYNTMYRRLTNTRTHFIAADSATMANISSLISISAKKFFGHQNGIAIFRNDSIVSLYPTPLHYNFPAKTFDSSIMLLDRKIPGQPKLILMSSNKTEEIPFPQNEQFDSSSLVFDRYSNLPVLMQNFSRPKNKFYLFNPVKKKFELLCVYPFNNSYGYGTAIVFGKDSAYFVNGYGKWMRTPEGKFRNLGNFMINNSGAGYLNKQLSDYSVLSGIYKNKTVNYDLPITTRIQTILEDEFYNSLYVGTLNKLYRVFPHVKIYPAVYNGSNSNATHFITQAADGAVYFGNYAGFLSNCKNGVITSININNTPLLPGGTFIDGALFAFTEKTAGLYKITRSNLKPVGNYLINGYFLLESNNKEKIFAGLSGYSGIGIISKKEWKSTNPMWSHIDSSDGMELLNVLTLAEDRYGRLWFGRPSQGWGVYYPDKGKAVTFLKTRNETTFGFSSSIIDKNGFIWMGGSNGLWYADTREKDDIHSDDPVRFEHPLLPDGKSINSLKIFNGQLIIGVDKNVLVMPLQLFHASKNKDLFHVPVRYFNPQELPLTAICEQNTLLIDSKDSSLWLATSENIYNINFKKWLSLPVYTTVPAISVFSNKDSVNSNGNVISFNPTQNSLQFEINYQTQDNMPRYLQLALTAAGDSVKWSSPTLNNTYTAANLQNGHYTFWVRVLQQNGTVTEHPFPFVIKNFLWQQWWFWALLSTGAISAALFLFNLKRKREVAEQKVKTKEAELLTYKKEQEKQLAKLQLLTLSSQFRPHFILNALNTIGAQMDDKPETESVLSRLGESVNLIFNHAHLQKILHPLEDEWRLVTNVIHIHTLMYLKQLEAAVPGAAVITAVKNTLVPLGILQIPVENALLHGLSNREHGPWQLSLLVTETEHSVVIEIKDNGVGRKKSATLSNFTKHGTGTKNLNDIVAIINAANTTKINIRYTDGIYSEGPVFYGTLVTIIIPKQLNDGSN